jgi:hypothetical protein
LQAPALPLGHVAIFIPHNIFAKNLLLGKGRNGEKNKFFSWRKKVGMMETDIFFFE